MCEANEPHAPWSGDRVRLEWIVVDGDAHHVSEYSCLNRPKDGVCPACGEPATTVHGTKRRHHVRHSVASKCPTNCSETALHLNTKLDLARRLSELSELSAGVRCRGGRSPYCNSTLRIDLPPWNAVQVEHKTGTRRPDITLQRDGVPVAAIEVFVHNRVTPKKAADLKDLGVPWFELNATEYRPGKSDPPELIFDRTSEPIKSCERCERHTEEKADPAPVLGERKHFGVLPKYEPETPGFAAPQPTRVIGRHPLVDRFDADLTREILRGTRVISMAFADIYTRSGTVSRDALLIVQRRPGSGRPVHELISLRKFETVAKWEPNYAAHGGFEAGRSAYEALRQTDLAFIDYPFSWFPIPSWRSNSRRVAMRSWLEFGLEPWIVRISQSLLGPVVSAPGASKGAHRQRSVFDPAQAKRLGGWALPSTSGQFSHLHLAYLVINENQPDDSTQRRYVWSPSERRWVTRFSLARECSSWWRNVRVPAHTRRLSEHNIYWQLSRFTFRDGRPQPQSVLVPQQNGRSN